MRLALVALLFTPATAFAHDFTPGVLALEETEPGLFRYAWTPPVDSGSTLPGALRFPSGCTTTEALLDCRPSGLEGTIEFPGISDRRVQVVVVIRRRDGTREESIVWGSDPQFDPNARSSPVALSGYLQLALILGLLVVASSRKQIALSLIAFTLAYSGALALAAFHLVRLASAPVSATSAAAALLLARESTHDTPTLTRRSPWLVALISGAILGLGTPADAHAGALLLGQLALCAVALAAVASGGRSLGTRSLRAISYAIGAVAAYGLIAGTIAIVTPTR